MILVCGSAFGQIQVLLNLESPLGIAPVGQGIELMLIDVVSEQDSVLNYLAFVVTQDIGRLYLYDDGVEVGVSGDHPDNNGNFTFHDFNVILFTGVVKTLLVRGDVTRLRGVRPTVRLEHLWAVNSETGYGISSFETGLPISSSRVKCVEEEYFRRDTYYVGSEMVVAFSSRNWINILFNPNDFELVGSTINSGDIEARPTQLKVVDGRRQVIMRAPLGGDYFKHYALHLIPKRSGLLPVWVQRSVYDPIELFWFYVENSRGPSKVRERKVRQAPRAPGRVVPVGKATTSWGAIKRR